MEKTDNRDESDIATEPYQGPGAFVTGAGEGAVAHYGTGTLGLFVGGLGGFIFQGKVNQWMTSWKGAAQRWQQSSTWGAPTLGKISGWLVGHPEGTLTGKLDKLGGSGMAKADLREFEQIRQILVHKEGGAVRGAAEHVLKIPGLRSLLSKGSTSRVSAAIAAGGLLGVTGFFVAPLYFMFTGAKHANHGRRQFHHAQNEIKTVRAENEELRSKYVEAKVEVDDLKAKSGEAKLPDTSELFARAAQVDSAVAADSPNVISHPKIESPVPKNQWWDGKEQPPAGHAEKLAVREAETAALEPGRA